ncbi:MAG: O-antigen ligase family protein [Nitrosomonadales bacterium]|nr:O-antigen ligase family protein [Nitrosomonadales bacterium]
MKNYRSTMNSLTQALGVLMVFVLIFPTALVNMALFLLLVVYCLSGGYRGKWQHIRGNPVAMFSLLLFGLFVVGISYSSASLPTALSSLNQYRELLLLPLAISVFTEDCWRQRAYYAFIAAILVALMVSFAMRLGWAPPWPVAQDTGTFSTTPFKSRIAYGFFLAFAIYLMAHHLLRSQTIRQRLLWGAATCLATFNLMFMVSGRTGHIILAALILLLSYQYWAGLRKRWPIYLVAAVVATTGVVATSPAIQGRSSDIALAVSDPEKSSIGQRLIMWQTALRVIADHPILGAGTGSFADEYAKKAYDHPGILTGNPHNEYLLITGQLGMLGLGGFLILFYRQWKTSAMLPLPYDYAAQGLVLAMAVGCLFNSFLYDHGEGHFFAIYSGLLFSGLDKRQPDDRGAGRLECESSAPRSLPPARSPSGGRGVRPALAARHSR